MAKTLSGAKGKLQFDTSDDSEDKPAKKHATGTTYSEDVFIAGEEGPELVVNHPGSKVYTANETRNILNPYNNSAPEAPIATREMLYSAQKTEKVVTLRLDGLGEIKLSGGNSKGVTSEQVVDILSKNLKPVLIDIVNNEVFEEAEESYDF